MCKGLFERNGICGIVFYHLFRLKSLFQCYVEKIAILSTDKSYYFKIIFIFHKIIIIYLEIKVIYLKIKVIILR